MKIQVKVKNPDEGSSENWVLETVEMLDPHAVLAFLCEAGLHLDFAAVEAFWTHAKRHRQPWAVDHPASASHVPVGLWGDGGTVFTEFGRYKMVAIFMNLPLWRPKNARLSRFMLFCIEGDKLYDYHTMLPIWRRITWSLNWAFEGLWPTHGPGGELLQTGIAAKRAGQFLVPGTKTKFACTEIRGDWSWLKETFRFPKCAWNAKRTCFKCPAVQSGAPGLLYFRHSEKPEDDWIHAEFDLVDFLQFRTPQTDPCH